MTPRVALLIAFSLLLPQRAFRSGVEVVRVDVSVVNGGKPVAGLKAGNFALTDNGRAQTVDSVTLDHLPISVTLVLDVSGSVAGEELTHLIDAGQQLVRSLRSGDRASLVTFSQEVLVNVPLTSDVGSIDRTLGTLRGSGATSMNDAIHVALNLRPVDTSRPVMIVFSDGVDNLSWSRPAALVDEVKKASIVIHAIQLQTTDRPAFRPTSPLLRSQGYLDRLSTLQVLTTQSGGRVWSAKSSRDLKRLFTEALEEMRARYVLTYTPTGVREEGWHDVKVSLKNARGDVTARPGYFVAAKEQNASGAPRE